MKFSISFSNMKKCFLSLGCMCEQFVWIVQLLEIVSKRPWDLGQSSRFFPRTKNFEPIGARDNEKRAVWIDRASLTPLLDFKIKNKRFRNKNYR